MVIVLRRSSSNVPLNIALHSITLRRRRTILALLFHLP
jgi:hypothetical protein